MAPRGEVPFQTDFDFIESPHHTEIERSQHLTQADPRVFGQYYLADCSSVSGMDVFLREKDDRRHIDFFQGLETQREEGLPGRLPAALEESLESDPGLCELADQVKKLRLAKVDTSLSRAASYMVSSYRRALKRTALRNYQRKWIRDRRDQKVIQEVVEEPDDSSRTDLARSLCLIMPERGRLAQWMAAQGPMSKKDSFNAMRDLVSMLRSDLRVAYLPGAKPVDGRCPMPACHEPLTRQVHWNQTACLQLTGL